MRRRFILAMCLILELLTATSILGLENNQAIAKAVDAGANVPQIDSAFKDVYAKQVILKRFEEDATTEEANKGWMGHVLSTAAAIVEPMIPGVEWLHYGSGSSIEKEITDLWWSRTPEEFEAGLQKEMDSLAGLPDKKLEFLDYMKGYGSSDAFWGDVNVYTSSILAILFFIWLLSAPVSRFLRSDYEDN